MTQTPAALEACPFCGGAVEIRERVFTGYPKFQIKCCAVNLYRSTKEALITAWNTRALAPRDVGALKLEIGNILPADLTPSQIIKFTIDHLASIGAIGGAVDVNAATDELAFEILYTISGKYQRNTQRYRDEVTEAIRRVLSGKLRTLSFSQAEANKLLDIMSAASNAETKGEK